MIPIEFKSQCGTHSWFATLPELPAPGDLVYFAEFTFDVLERRDWHLRSDSQIIRVIVWLRKRGS